MSSDPLFQGMTRPAMLAGVTYSGVILNLMLVITPFVMLNSLWPLLAAIPIHGVMWLVCKWDPRFFDLDDGVAANQRQRPPSLHLEGLDLPAMKRC